MMMPVYWHLFPSCELHPVWSGCNSYQQPWCGECVGHGRSSVRRLLSVSNKYFLRLTKVVGGLDFSILPYWKRKEDLIYITDKIKVEESEISRTTRSVCWPGMRGWCWGWEPQWTRWQILLISQRSPATYTLRRASMSSSGNDNYMRCTALVLSYDQYWSNHSLIGENCPFSLQCIDKTSSNMLEWTSTALVA